ncbi:2-oxo-4-hydroxy-4-carboxy-5-ureidoimidazoline decarboxylase [Edaphobacter modestus]|uniref:OHCU decarboxylase n=1 Tax=Edaphobacter modestus TaxID=388466 RepID=A0A4Q7YNL9_9BACT|nr:2-oxo-4-hydroxy-4-carboxy-5-ureidoimidazoline decarboxylase [Edaphobacter modestus]RZU39000.1 OHCU decarboxylase [Edaphobacter modestus]
MRSIPSNFEVVAPSSLASALEVMARSPGEWTPLAGGTELMVQYGAGRLAAHRFVNIWGFPELREIRQYGAELHVGAGCTYTDLRRNPTVLSEFPLLSTAASWTGSIANQNRGTLGGNIVNASPAADSLPALLVYEAELVLISAVGERRIPYTDFHIGYKQTRLRPDELIRAIVLPRCYSDYMSRTQKVGPRNAQAISKLCMAALAKIKEDRVEDIRIAMGSMAPIPLRLRKTEAVLMNNRWSLQTFRAARLALESEVSPIDDIRSTRTYRIAVAGNLLEEFLLHLFSQFPVPSSRNFVLERWNSLPFEAAVADLLSCCGSRAWAEQVVSLRPYATSEDLSGAAKTVWQNLDPEHWMEAFQSHPRIGERHAERPTTDVSAAWSATEQRAVQQADVEIKHAIAEGNRRYETRFGRIFIICAGEKTPSKILSELERRMTNDDETEMKESAAQQEQILELRLKRWLSFQEGA